MNTLHPVWQASPLTLDARTAVNLMTPNPVSIRQGTTVGEAAAFLAARGIGAAPVIDEAGRPVGVVSRTDLLIHKGQGADEQYVVPVEILRDGADQRPTVADVMTPTVFCVRPETPAAEVVEKLLALNVRRLFVVDDDGILIGVISTFDVLRKLRRRSARG